MTLPYTGAVLNGTINYNLQHRTVLQSPGKSCKNGLLLVSWQKKCVSFYEVTI